MAGVWWAFSRTQDVAPRLLMLSSATLLVAPYWLNYDLMMPTLAIVFIAARESANAPFRREHLVWLLVWFLPHTMIIAQGAFELSISAATILLLFAVTLQRPELAHEKNQRPA
jgi:hypothetical protein